MVFGKIARWVLRQITRKCPKCRNVFIDLIFDNFAKDKLIRHMCNKCKFEQRLFWPLNFLLAKYIRYADEPGGMREVFSNTWFRKYVVNLINGIGKFGIGPPLVYGAPAAVTMNLTRLCNLKCPHCYQEGDTTKLPNELSTKEIISIISELADYGVIGVLFGGGEPLVHPGIFKIIKATIKNGMFANLSTNGTLITEELAKKLKVLGLTRATISLDGIDETHDLIRGQKGTFQRALRGIKNCKAAGLETAIAITLTKHNCKEIPQLVELAKELKLDGVLLNNFIPVGRGKDNADLDVTPEEREAVLKYLYKELIYASNGEFGIECITGASPFYARIAYQTPVKKGRKIIPVAMHTATSIIKRYNINKHYQDKLWSLFNTMASYIGACTIATSYSCINPQGDVWPCTLIPIRIGNLRTQRFADIWEKNSLLNDLRNRKKFKGPCRDCFYYTCRGCRARALAYKGDILESDNQCLECIRVLQK